MFIALSMLSAPLNARVSSHVPGGLRITVIKAYNLPETDGVGIGVDLPDPYATVVAYKLDGSHETRYTDVKDGDILPVWNQELSFGNGQWSHFHIQIWDRDTGLLEGDDDLMTDDYRVDILTPCSKDVERLGNKIEYSYYVDYSF